MKTLINKTTKTALYLWEDSEFIELKEDLIVVGSPVKYHIGDLSSSTAELIENVVDPTDFMCSKYKYIDGQWVNNHPTDDGVTYTWNKDHWTWEGRDDGTKPPSEQWKASDCP